MDARDGMWRAGVGRRLAALFRAMSADVLLREQFITDPSQVISEYVAESRLPAERAAAINRLIYSVVGNRGLFIWLRGYAVQQFGRTVSTHQFLRDFSVAVARHNGYHVVLALMHATSESDSPLSVENLGFTIPLTMGVFGPAADGVRVQGVGNVITDMFTAVGPAGGPLTLPQGFTATDLTFSTDVHTGTTITFTDHTITQLTISDTFWTLHTQATQHQGDTGTSLTGTSTGTGITTLPDTGTGMPDTGTGTPDTGTGTPDTGTGTPDTGTGTPDTGTGTPDTGTGTPDTGTGTPDTGTGTPDTGTGTPDTGTGTGTGTPDTGIAETFTQGGFTDVGGVTDPGTVGGFVPFSPANFAAVSLVAIAQYAASLIGTGALDAGPG